MLGILSATIVTAANDPCSLPSAKSPVSYNECQIIGKDCDNLDFDDYDVTDCQLLEKSLGWQKKAKTCYSIPCSEQDGYKRVKEIYRVDEMTSACFVGNCVTIEKCGDNITNGNEICDGEDERDCETNGKDGTKTCKSDCSGWNKCEIYDTEDDDVFTGKINSESEDIIEQNNEIAIIETSISAPLTREQILVKINEIIALIAELQRQLEGMGR